MKASLIRINKVVRTRLDTAKQIIKVFLVLKEDELKDLNITFSDNDITVLAYFILFGINRSTKELIINSKVCKTLNSVNVVMTKLKKASLIYKDDLNGKRYVSKELAFPLNKTTGIYINLKTETDEY